MSAIHKARILEFDKSSQKRFELRKSKIVASLKKQNLQSKYFQRLLDAINSRREKHSMDPMSESELGDHLRDLEAGRRIEGTAYAEIVDAVNGLARGEVIAIFRRKKRD